MGSGLAAARMPGSSKVTLYGIGSRLDLEPELLFKLRGVDHLELIAQAGSPVAKTNGTGKKTIATDRLTAAFFRLLRSAFV
jgi:uncharacterized Zn finger protein